MTRSALLLVLLLPAGCSDDASDGAGGATSSSAGDPGSGGSSGIGGSAGTGGGGGGVSEGGLPFLSGPRLRARVLDGGDGALALLDFHDVELGTACSAATTSDGVVRCVPHGGIDFADPDCTRPAILVTECGSPSFGQRTIEGADCEGDRVEAFARTDEALGDELFYLDGDNCVSGGSYAGTFYAAVRLDDSSMVGSSEATEPFAEGLSRAVRVWDDGARVALGLVDDESGATCSPTELEGAGLRCVPKPVAHAYDDYPSYGDGACEEQVAEQWVACGAPEPRFILQRGPTGSCGGGDDLLLQVGEAREGHLGSPGACTADTSGDYRYYALGEAADAESLVALETVHAGGGRLQVQGHGIGSGWAEPHGGSGSSYATLYDVQLDATCTPMPFADGTLRCLPEAEELGIFEYFSNPSCTSLLVETYDECTPARYAATSGGSTGGCILLVGDVYPVLEPHVGTVYEDDPFDGCVEVEDPGPMRALGTALAPTTFAALVERVE